MPSRGRPRRPAQTVAEQHAEWLGLLRPDGPFLALPVLVNALPQGLDTVPDDVRGEIRRAWEEVQDDPGVLLAARCPRLPSEGPVGQGRHRSRMMPSEGSPRDDGCVVQNLHGDPVFELHHVGHVADLRSHHRTGKRESV